MADLKETLEEIGYRLTNHGKYYQTSAVYRDGKDQTSLVIYPQDDLAVDFVTTERFSISELIARTLNLQGPALENWIKSRQLTLAPKIAAKPLIQDGKRLDKSVLNELAPDHSYWINRGVSESILKEFRGGVSKSGKMADRYVFPVFDSKDNIIGLTGRDLTGKKRAKWKHLTLGNAWRFPLFLNYGLLKERKEVILVESLGDCLSLFEAGIRNVIVTFGLEVSTNIVNLLLSLDLNKIIISFNNDEKSENNPGRDAAFKAQNKLSRYFDRHQIKIQLPTQANDWNEYLLKYGKEKLRKEFVN